MKHGPTSAQKDVLLCTDDLVVVGGPGCGKTTVALAKAHGLILEGNLRGRQKVLFLSFSNAAVQRIQATALGALPREVRQSLEITTIHSFCYELLRTHWRLAGLKMPFRILSPEDARILASFYPSAEQWEEEQQRLEVEEGRVNFDRFATLAAQVLQASEVLKWAYSSAYPLVVADEYQDTADDQHDLIQLLARPGQVICLGDPDQRIYDWRPGIRPDRLDRLEASGFRRITLETNHRNSTIDLPCIAQAVLKGKTSIRKPRSVGVLRYGDAESMAKCLKLGLTRLEKKIREESTSLGRPSVAILAFTNDFVARLSLVLNTPSKGYDFPFVHSVLIPPEAVSIAWRTVMNTLMASDPAEMAGILLRGVASLKRVKHRAGSLDAPERLERWALDCESGSTPKRAKGVHTLFEQVRTRCGHWSGDPIADIERITTALADVPGGHLDPLQRVLELCPVADPRGELSRDLSACWATHGDYRDAEHLGEAFLTRQRLELGASADGGRVLMTLHKCKGKEFDGVIIVNGRNNWSIIAPEDRPEAGYERSRRLLHVALTRARHGAVFLTPHGEECPIWPAFTA